MKRATIENFLTFPFVSLFPVVLPFDFLIRMLYKPKRSSQENVIVQDHSFFDIPVTLVPQLKYELMF